MSTAIDQELQDIQRVADTIQSVDQFRRWVCNPIRSLIPHQSLACGHGRIHAAGIATDYILTVNFPNVHLQEICNPAGGLDTPLMRRWLDTRQVVLFDPDRHHHWPEISPAWLARFQANQLRNAAVHAVFDTQRCIGTYFSFHRLENSPQDHLIPRLEALVPVMHEVLMRVIHTIEKEEQKQKPTWERLTERELEIARWVGQGSTNTDIATHMQASENTIKHHLTSILKKQNFRNRAELAVAVAKWPPGILTRGIQVL